MMTRLAPGLAGLLLSAAAVLANPVGLYCANGGNSFLIGQPVGGGAFDLRISSWQGMHHCGIAGVARATSDGWLLETEGCTLRLLDAGGALVLATPADGACAPFCGARATLDGLTFPHASRVSESADPSLFARDLGELDPC